MAKDNVTSQVTATKNHPLEPPVGDRLRTHLIKGAAGSFVIQVGFAGLAFLNAVILARVLGAGGYGAFANAMAWVSLLVIPATFGFGILLVRDVAIYRTRGEWAALRGLLRFSNSFVLALSVLLTLLFLAVAGFVFSAPDQEAMRLLLWIAAPLVPLFALSNLRESATRGLEHVFRASLPGMIFRPGLLLTGIVSIYLLWPDRLSAPAAMAVNVGAATIALAAGIFWLRKVLPFEVKQAQPEYKARFYLKAAFPMLVYGGMQIILGQTDIVMLGAMRGAEEVGLYAAASRLAYLLVFVMVAANIIMAPIMARLYTNGEKARLQKILTRAVRIAFLTVLPFGLLMIFSGENILIVFGHDFVAAKTALIILAVGRLVDVALGSAVLVLSMTGYERIVAVTFAVMSLVNIVFNAVMIPKYGIEGAAIASATSLIIAKVFMGVYIVINADLYPTIFGSISWGKLVKAKA